MGSRKCLVLYANETSVVYLQGGHSFMFSKLLGPPLLVDMDSIWSEGWSTIVLRHLFVVNIKEINRRCLSYHPRAMCRVKDCHKLKHKINGRMRVKNTK